MSQGAHCLVLEFWHSSATWKPDQRKGKHNLGPPSLAPASCKHWSSTPKGFCKEQDTRSTWGLTWRLGPFEKFVSISAYVGCSRLRSIIDLAIGPFETVGHPLPS